MASKPYKQRTPWLDRVLNYFHLDEEVDEVLINGNRSVFLQKGTISHQEKSLFNSAEEVTKAIQEFSFLQNMRIDPYFPVAGGDFLEGNYRWHAVIPPVSSDGGLFSLRKHRFTSIGVESFHFNDEVFDHMEELILNKKNILICGETGSGKTSLLISLLKKYSRSERVMLLESLAEMPLLFPSWARMVERTKTVGGHLEVSLDSLLKESLRLRPDRIVVGEIRGKEGVVFLESLIAGHSGCMATLHAASIHDVKNRFELLLLKEGLSLEFIERLFRQLHDLYCVFVKRGSPPLVSSLEAFIKNDGSY